MIYISDSSFGFRKMIISGDKQANAPQTTKQSRELDFIVIILV